LCVSLIRAKFKMPNFYEIEFFSSFISSLAVLQALFWGCNKLFLAFILHILYRLIFYWRKTLVIFNFNCRRMQNNCTKIKKTRLIFFIKKWDEKKNSFSLLFWESFQNAIFISFLLCLPLFHSYSRIHLNKIWYKMSMLVVIYLLLNTERVMSVTWGNVTSMLFCYLWIRAPHNLGRKLKENLQFKFIYIYKNYPISKLEKNHSKFH
jgi:hypothetical protein